MASGFIIKLSAVPDLCNALHRYNLWCYYGPLQTRSNCVGGAVTTLLQKPYTLAQVLTLVSCRHDELFMSWALDPCTA